jgi:hypothetical protein
MSYNKQSIPWARLAAESAAIIFSILIAFSLDAWRAEWQDRQTERDDLERLHVEFIWNRDRVNDNGTATRAQVASTEMYGLVIAHLGHDTPLEIPNALLRNVFGTPTFDAATPVLDGLVLSGRLENIRAPDVLSAISYWQRQLQQVEETEVNARAFMATQLDPALNTRGNFGPVRMDTDPDGFTAIMIDEELIGLVAKRARNTRFVIGTLDRLKAAANDVVIAIEKAQNE